MTTEAANLKLLDISKVKDSCDSARRWEAIYSKSLLASLALDERTHESI